MLISIPFDEIKSVFRLISLMMILSESNSLIWIIKIIFKNNQIQGSSKKWDKKKLKLKIISYKNSNHEIDLTLIAEFSHYLKLRI